jgi:plastocyanin
MAAKRNLVVSMVGSAALAASIITTTVTAQATTTVQVKIVASSSTCSSLFCYHPAKKSIAAGVRVKWVNNTSAQHTVTRCTPSACNGRSGGTGTSTGLRSGLIGPGGTYGFTFKGKGTYVYYCTVHGYGVMHGVITVT